jgi:hypothetical protein
MSPRVLRIFSVGLGRRRLGVGMENFVEGETVCPAGHMIAHSFAAFLAFLPLVAPGHLYDF